MNFDKQLSFFVLLVVESEHQPILTQKLKIHRWRYHARHYPYLFCRRRTLTVLLFSVHCNSLVTINNNVIVRESFQTLFYKPSANFNSCKFNYLSFVNICLIYLCCRRIGH
jgi:hypothetical protein